MDDWSGSRPLPSTLSQPSETVQQSRVEELLARRLFGLDDQDGSSSSNIETFAASSSANDSLSQEWLWPTQQQRPSGHLLLLFALLVLINLIVILGNILVILAVYASAKLRNVTNLFIVSLATADLLLGIFVLPYALMFEVSSFSASCALAQ